MRNNFEENYRELLRFAIAQGTGRNDRTGVGCSSVFNQQLSWNLSTGKFPLITGRKMFPKTFKTEFEWFINGETNIKRFQDAGVKIWDAWADHNGDLGPVYGYQMRNFGGYEYADQLTETIRGLNETPDSRRHIISLWNPLQLEAMRLPPCYLYFQFFVDHDTNQVNMFVVMRSADLFLGVPYDVALFSQLLLYICDHTPYAAGRIDLQMVDAHVYDNQWEPIKDYMSQQTYQQPDYSYVDKTLNIANYHHGPVITAPVAV